MNGTNSISPGRPWNSVEDFNATDHPRTLGFSLPRLVEKAASVHSSEIAVVCGNYKWTYSTLNSAANQLARYLITNHAIKTGDVISVALNRSINLIVSILAIMKAGAVYMPIDPALPAKRVKQMTDDANPKVAIASSDASAIMSFGEDITIDIDAAKGESSILDGGNLTAVSLQPEDLAYIIYTSGSTGTPKGAQANHEALCNLLLSMQRNPGCGRGDRLLAVASVSFDISIADMLLPLVSGATLVLAQTHEFKDADAVLDLMRRHAISMAQATPSFWQMLLDSGWQETPRVAKIVAAGEPLSHRLVERLVSRTDEVWNAYGPSEATIYASMGKVELHDENISIGSPVPNFQLYVLHPNELSPVPLGSTGELCIGGIGVNCGYHNNLELTKTRFLDNSFHPGRLYRTGDLAKFIAPGKLILVGRTDSQVKVRGYRIELEDISTAIASHQEISAAVVISRDDQIIAYCLRSDQHKHHANEDHQTGTEWSLDSFLRPWLANRLPAYMIPAFFVRMDTFPRTVNGKIDRKALPDPIQTTNSRSMGAKPQSEVESHIISVWSHVLGHDRIGINDNFFQIGGTSLRIPHVKTDLERLLGRAILTAKLFEHYTVQMLAKYLTDGVDDSNPSTSSTPSVPSNQSEQSHLAIEKNEDIAIIAMACHLPGGITCPEQYWKFLEQGLDGITDVPKDRWDGDTLFDANADAPGKSYSRRGGFIDGIDTFDAPFFGISPTEAKTLDPAQNLILETCWEGFEGAGYTMQKLRGSQTGVFIGSSNIPAHSATPDLEDLDGYALTGSSSATLSGRVSYVLGLEGPSLTVDTACSSSLVSTHLACSALRQKECDLAIAGGITILSPGIFVEFSRLRGMSSDGHCRAFSADAQGTGLSEGSTAVVLKRLSDAQRDGDIIHAVLRGSSVNHGGRRAANLTIPSGSAQESLIREALSRSQVGPGDIEYIEAHGTATKLGDPIEGTALSEVFSERGIDQKKLWVGSSKSNLGHTQAAAGLAGVIKVALAMQHSMLPQTIHVREPTPLVDWEKANMALVLKNQPWVSVDKTPRRAGVSSFGIGGTNAHMIVEEAPQVVKTKGLYKRRFNSPPTLPFLMSAYTKAALRQQVEKLEKWMDDDAFPTDKISLEDLAFSLATSRTQFRKRLVVLARDREDLVQKMRVCSEALPGHLSSRTGLVYDSNSGSNEEPRLAFLFTGQGSQQLGMGRGLSQTYPYFRETLQSITSYFTDLEKPLLEVMWADPQSEAAAFLSRTDFAQPAIFALEVALCRLWQIWGVQPQVVLGHSVGEIAAAHIAGVLDLPNACRLVAARGRLMEDLTSSRHGSMASLQASATEVTTAISALSCQSKVEIAACNTPEQTVISGDRHAVELVGTYIAHNLGRKVTPLKVSHAFHSYHINDMLPAFRTVAETIQFNSPKLAIISSLTGKFAEAHRLGQPEYWVQQARKAVLFSDSMEALCCQQGVNIWLEVGPQPVLSGIAASYLNSARAQEGRLPALLPSLMTGKKDDRWVILNSLAKLHVKHSPIDWPRYFDPFGYQRIQLPTYAFQRQRWSRIRTPNTATNPRGSIAEGKYNSSNNDVAPASTSSSRQHQFEVIWTPIERSETAIKSGNSSWGLMYPVGQVCWAHNVQIALSYAGVRTVQVKRLEDATGLDGLLCFWDGSSDVDVPQRAFDLTTAALNILQTAANIRFAPPLVWITRGAQMMDGDDNTLPHNGHKDDDGMANTKEQHVASAPLWGLMRTARYEHQDLDLRLIDWSSKKDNAEGLSLALDTSANEPECAIRKGQTFRPLLQRVDTPKAQSLALRRDGTLLITGALGGIGQHLCKWLVRSHNVRKLVLTSRRGMKAPGAELLVGELAQLGATTTVVACDVGDYSSVKSLMSSFNEDRPLRGVIHAAGLVDSSVLANLTAQQLATTFKAKVEGSWYLHKATQDMDLDIFMVFSSISGVLGLPGLGNYAAANTFVDALAHLRRAQGLPATSVAYGVWGGKGMGANLSGRTARTHLTRFGLDPLSPADGLESFERAVNSGRALTVAARLDLNRLQSQQEEERGSVPSFFRLLFDQKDQFSSSDKVKADPQPKPLRRVLRESPPKQHAKIVLDMVRETVSKALGYNSSQEVATDVALQDIGFDSLTAVLIRNNLAALTQLKTLSTSNITWNHPNLKSLSQYLLSEIRNEASIRDRNPNTQTFDELPNGARSANGVSSRPDMSLARKGRLDPKITFDSANGRALDRPRSVFMTGATGFVGAFILYELLERGVSAHCLVRAEGKEHGMRRLVTTLTSYCLWNPQYASRLYAVVGNIAEPFFDLGTYEFDRLSDDVDAICHAGALVDWMRPLDEYIGPNVISTHEVLRLASRGRCKAIHVVSTLATLPKYHGLQVHEDDREFGYSTSKYMAERMVSAARWRGAKASVYRVPFVTASATSGHFRLDRGDFLHNLIAGCIEMGSFPILNADLSVVLPVDYLSRTIASIMTDDRARIDHDFDFFHASAPSSEYFFELMSAAAAAESGNDGRNKCDMESFAQWQQRALAYASMHPKSSLARIIAVVDDLTDDSAPSILRGCPPGQYVFGSEIYPAPLVDKHIVGKYYARMRDVELAAK